MMTDPLQAVEAGHKSVEGQTARGAMWVSAEMIGVQGTSFLVFATMAHFVRPRDFGLISICYFAVQSLEMLILYNIATVAFRRQKVIALEFTTAFWITIGLALFLFFGLLSCAKGAECLFHAPGLAPILRAMSVILLFIGLSRTHETWLIRHFQFKTLSIRGIAGAIIGGVTGVTLAIRGCGVDALVGQQIATSLVSTSLLWLVCPWRPSFSFSMPAARDICGFMVRMLPNNLVYAINQNCDTFLVAFFFGPASVGLYNVGKRVKLALQLVAGNPISAIGLPALAEIQDNPVRLHAGVLRSLTIICAVCSPIFFGASAVAGESIIVVFGPHWVGAVPVMQLLSFSGLAMVLITFNDNVFLLKDRPIWCLLVSLSYATLAVTALLTLSHFHITSLALPFVLPYCAVLPFSIMLMSKLVDLHLRDVVAATFPGLSTSLVMFAGVHWAAGHLPACAHIIRLAVLCAFGAVIYSTGLICMWRSTAMLLLGMLRHLRPGRMVKNLVL